LHTKRESFSNANDIGHNPYACINKIRSLGFRMRDLSQSTPLW